MATDQTQRSEKKKNLKFIESSHNQEWNSTSKKSSCKRFVIILLLFLFYCCYWFKGFLLKTVLVIVLQILFWDLDSETELEWLFLHLPIMFIFTKFWTEFHFFG